MTGERLVELREQFEEIVDDLPVMSGGWPAARAALEEVFGTLRRNRKLLRKIVAARGKFELDQIIDEINEAIGEPTK